MHRASAGRMGRVWGVCREEGDRVHRASAGRTGRVCSSPCMDPGVEWFHEPTEWAPLAPAPGRSVFQRLEPQQAQVSP